MIRHKTFLLLAFLSVGAVIIAACSDSGTSRSSRIDTGSERPDTEDAQDTTITPDIPGGPFVIEGVLGPDGQPLTGKPLGMACADSSECRINLTCADDKTCQPSGTAAAGELCVLSVECAEGLACGLTARCEPAGDAAAGEGCGGPSECGRGLRCDIAGLSGVCQAEGGAEIGEACTAASDCRAPLACDPTGKCAIPIMGGFAFPPDTVCADNDSSALIGYFDLPDAANPTDFYRLPFPNDALLKGGGIDLSAHPNPGTNYIGGDLIDAYVSALGSDTPGFSPNPTVFFRFSQPVRFDSIKAGGGVDQNMYFLNITAGSPSYGRGSSLGWFMTTGRGKYICQNFLTVRPPWSAPLEPGQTYAVFFTNGVKADDGKSLSRDVDFTAVMGDARPADPIQAAGWDAYAPLRAYLADDTVTPTLSADQVMTAAVFTVQDPSAAFGRLRQAVLGAAAPQLTTFARCEPDQASPCGGGRTCAPANAGYTELHGLYSAPIWQSGTRPFLTEGGQLSPDPASGAPQAQGQENLCVVMTVPTGTMPAGGWPVVLYAHGTGGDAQSHLRDGTAAAVSSINDAPPAAPTQFATLAIDGVQHGDRRGGSTLSPDVLFYNFANPRAGRGNVQQAAADYFYLVRLAQTLSLAPAASPTGEALAINPDQIHFFGHSQGATVGALVAPHEPALRSVVLSGGGGGLTLSLLQKTSPLNVAAATQFLLNDGQVGDNHPVLHLVQTWFDQVDPLNHARFLFRAPAASRTPTDVLMSLGEGDTFTPRSTTESLAAAMNLQQGRPGEVTIDENLIRPIDLPATANRAVNGQDSTAVLVSFQPASGEDGHFVLLRDSDAIIKYTTFLSTAAKNSAATVP